jgi:hypothetical protein
MNKVKFLFGVFLILFMGLSFASPVGARMIREITIGSLTDAPNLEIGDRFYMRYHGPEIVRLSGPWITRFWIWRTHEPPAEAVERFGARGGRYIEIWYREEDFADRPMLRGTSQRPWEGGHTPEERAVEMVPANPTEVFYDSDPHPEQTPILRWVTMFRYPEGVSDEEGEKWFLEVHAKEAAKQPGLLKFVSYLAPAELKDGGMGVHVKFWDRVCEYWYRDFDAWRKAVLDSPPDYTAPPWGGEYPFVIMYSNFIPYYHEIDLLKGTYQFDFDQPKVNYNTSP